MDAFSQKATQARAGGYVAPRLKSSRKNILWSSSPSGWSFRNIHNSNGNGSFTFYADVFTATTFIRLDCIY